MSELKNPEANVVARELIARFGSRAEEVRRGLEDIAREQHRADALLTLMRAETWLALLVRR